MHYPIFYGQQFPFSDPSVHLNRDISAEEIASMQADNTDAGFAAHKKQRPAGDAAGEEPATPQQDRAEDNTNLIPPYQFASAPFHVKPLPIQCPALPAALTEPLGLVTSCSAAEELASNSPKQATPIGGLPGHH
jgi:hypothetical protein